MDNIKSHAREAGLIFDKLQCTFHKCFERFASGLLVSCCQRLFPEHKLHLCREVGICLSCRPNGENKMLGANSVGKPGLHPALECCDILVQRWNETGFNLSPVISCSAN